MNLQPNHNSLSTIGFPLRGVPSLSWPFCPVFTSTLLASGHAGTVKHTTNDMIPNARQIPDSASANYNCAVLLQVVVDTRYVSCNFLGIGQSDTSDFSQSGVWLFGRLSSYNQTHASFLRRATDFRYSFLALRFYSWPSDQLVYSRHKFVPRFSCSVRRAKFPELP